MPIAVLWFYFIALSLVSVFSEGRNEIADLTSPIVFSSIVSLWVLTDAHHREKQLCYDYGTFVFFGWPIFVPIYLFQTRGVRAFITLFCFAGICATTILFAFALAYLRELAS